MSNSIKSTTPTLKDTAALSQMLVHVAKQDQHYTGDKALTLSATKEGMFITEHGTVMGDGGAPEGSRDNGCTVSADVLILRTGYYPTACNTDGLCNY